VIVIRISFGICGRYPLSEIVAFALSVGLVLIWIVTGHWLFMDGNKRRRKSNCSSKLSCSSDRHWSMHFVHCLGSSTESQSVSITPTGSGDLRCLLGLLFSIHFHNERDGSCSNTRRRKPGKRHRWLVNLIRIVSTSS
jgi:hypothetical protein